MDSKIEQIQNTVMNALEKLELNPRDRIVSISLATDENVSLNLVNKSANNNLNVPTPEQTSFRNCNIALTDVILPKFGNDERQNPLKFIRDLENVF